VPVPPSVEEWWIPLVNFGTVVLGVLNGMTVGLLAVGLVLVYKSNRFINLAHAQMGTVSALLLAKWALDWGWDWWVAFALAVGVGLLTGLAVERLLVRPLRRGRGHRWHCCCCRSECLNSFWL
jgi:branched-subunit amino acid ABC-type transport system permease component